MEKQKNDCYQCPYRREVRGSAHSECVHPGIANGAITAWGLMNNPTGLEPDIKLHPTGINGGWATWPVNFDPVWITCHLKIEKQ